MFHATLPLLFRISMFFFHLHTGMDVPEGFLLEWWSTMFDFDFFRKFVQVRLHERQRLQISEEGNAFQAAQQAVNAHTDQLPDNFTSTSNGGSNSMASHASDEAPLLFIPSFHQEIGLIGDELSQIFLPYSNREELLRPTLRTNNLANTTDQKVESSVQNGSKAENAMFNERSRGMDDLLACGEGSTSMNAFAGITSPALEDDDDECAASNCPCSFQEVSTAADTSSVNQLDSSKER